MMGPGGVSGAEGRRYWLTSRYSYGSCAGEDTLLVIARYYIRRYPFNYIRTYLHLSFAFVMNANELYRAK